MPKCPQCNKEINCLRSIVTTRQEFEFYLDEDGNENWEPTLNSGPDKEEDLYFYCPECGEDLFSGIEQAKAFLKVEGKEERNVCSSSRREG